jgi:hypothetical protein
VCNYCKDSITELNWDPPKFICKTLKKIMNKKIFNSTLAKGAADYINVRLHSMEVANTTEGSDKLIKLECALDEYFTKEIQALSLARDEEPQPSDGQIVDNAPTPVPEDSESFVDPITPVVDLDLNTTTANYVTPSSDVTPLVIDSTLESTPSVVDTTPSVVDTTPLVESQDPTTPEVEKKTADDCGLIGQLEQIVDKILH